MALYTSESRDRVREAVDFVELVSARTELRRAGPARYEGLCPFHDERTPSFGIDPGQKVYHCFGCQASGDVFTFVQETEGVDFKEALELLAERYGVELQSEREDPGEAERRRRRERLLELLERTCSYYERYLWESSEAARARAYLQERGLGEETLRQFRVGFAPSAWDRVLKASRAGGFTEAELYATGLAQRSRQGGQPYDRFRARIMFPLTDIRGRVLGFGARALDGGERGSPAGAGAPAPGTGDRRGEGSGGRDRVDARGVPKYLNTSDNDVYHKGLHLYGAHLARSHAAQSGAVIVCEGYTDTIALHQAGLRNSVGLMGTALTAEQVGELARMVQTVLLALDADSSGQEAMLRAWSLAAKRKLELRVVLLPAGADPAELLMREGAGAMTAAVERAISFVRFRVERVLEAGDEESPEGRDRMIEQLRPVISALVPGAMRMELTRLVSDRLNLPESVAERALSQGSAGAGRSAAAAGARTGADPRRALDGPQEARAQSAARGQPTERAFLALCIASPGAGAQALAELNLEEHFTSDSLRRAARHLRAHLSDPGRAIPEDDPQLAALIAELVVQAGRERTPEDMLEVQQLQLELARLDRQIQRSRGAEQGDVSELATHRAQVKREFDRAYGRVLERTGERAG